MKYILLSLLAIPAFSAPAAAQSLTDTHRAHWLPAGKTPILTWHPRAEATCTTTSDHQQVAKGQLPRVARCERLVDKASTEGARPAAAGK